MLIGFWAFVMLNVARYWVIRQTGYAFLLPVLLVGTVLMYVVDVSLTALGQVLDSERSRWIFHLGSTTWAAATATLVPLLANAVLGRKRSTRLAAEWRGNLTECLLEDSIDSRGLVELTLETGKSYVGFIVESGIATPKEADMSIVPIFSGHRDEEQQLQLTTSYIGAILKVPRGDDFLYRFELVLSKRQIVSARRFDVETFEARFGRPLPEPTRGYERQSGPTTRTPAAG